MTELTPNPASRLASLLRHAARSASKATVQSVWSNAFEVEGAALTRSFHQLAVLTQEIRVVGSGVVGQEEPADALATQVEKAMLLFPSGEWRAFWTTLGGQATIGHLQTMSGLFDLIDPLKLRITDVDALRTRLEEITDEVKTAPPGALTDEVRREVVQDLTALRASLGRVGAGSSRTFRVISTALIGRFLNDHTTVDHLKGSAAGRSVLGLLVAIRLSTGIGLVALTGAVADALPAPDPIVVNVIESECKDRPALGSGDVAPQLEAGTRGEGG